MNRADIDFTQAWWSNKLGDPPALLRFLEKLHYTEFSGYKDNIDAAYRWAPLNPAAHHIFCQTAEDEMRHAELLVPLVLDRGGRCDGIDAPPPSFYWDEMDKAIVSLDTCAAVFHLGEKLAAERFEVMLDNAGNPEDIRAFLEAVIPDEQHHARIFGKLAGPEAIAAMQAHHDKTVIQLKDAGGS
ncbi:hypothetical protein HOU03_gp324 [Caulobacter phage CcrSC]|uniref:Rubrerythrin diiron-binding domain-containing protein n=1 Tax=Caulobacter phage CcrSC TaxID=2283272 RepID=A0A385EDI5_9CAUD|nr:hypothetical protein HOU03_gp324 [Caulobacter phage CcrSC]AXQ69944.1 hypothetical protein CcrSC_gp362 [Caulobacter phage CcrSC]